MQQAWHPSLIGTIYYLVVLVIVALVINNLFVALVCFGFSRSSQDIAKELDERAAASMGLMDNDGISLHYSRTYSWARTHKGRQREKGRGRKKEQSELQRKRGLEGTAFKESEIE